MKIITKFEIHYKGFLMRRASFLHQLVSRLQLKVNLSILTLITMNISVIIGDLVISCKLADQAHWGLLQGWMGMNFNFILARWSTLVPIATRVGINITSCFTGILHIILLWSIWFNWWGIKPLMTMLVITFKSCCVEI